MKKGFTLVELLAVLVIIAVISLVILPVVSKHIDTSKEDLYKVQVSSIEKAAKDYLLSDEGKQLRKDAMNKDIFITLSYLQENDYLEKEEIKNPLNGNTMSGVIRVTYQNNNYVFSYLEMDVVEAEKTTLTIENYILKKENIYTMDSSNDGLYLTTVRDAVDMDLSSQEKRIYYYRGNNPNNYIKLLLSPGNAEIWNIVSIDTTNRVAKLVRTRKVKSKWADSNETTDYLLHTPSLKMNKYLQETVYNGLPTSMKESLASANWLLGEVSASSKTIGSVIQEEKEKNYTSKVSLLSLSDYMNASLPSSCRTTAFNEQCAMTNWLTNFVVTAAEGQTEVGYFLRNTVKNEPKKVWSVTSTGLSQASLISELYVYPVIYLPIDLVLDSSMDETTVKALGSAANPYILKLYED